MTERARRRWWAALVVVTLLVTGGYGVFVNARGAAPNPAIGPGARAAQLPSASAVTERTAPG